MNVKLAYVWMIVSCLAEASLAQEPVREPLWPDGAPGALGSTDKDRPMITWHVPETGNGAAIVVCPGGGYGHLAMGHEGKQIGEWLNDFGVTAIVLEYRLGPRYRHPAPLQDVRRALRTVRARAAAHSIDPARIGVLGFSAGGHLAASASTLFEAGDAAAEDPVERVSSRPDFAILCYPVIMFRKPHGHVGSGRNLLGPEATEEQLEAMSLQKRVTKDTPPTFLFHTNEDRGVPPENSIQYYLALREHGVPAELHIYEKGRHGVGLAPGQAGTSSWPERCREWLEVRAIIPPKKGSQ